MREFNPLRLRANLRGLGEALEGNSDPNDEEISSMMDHALVKLALQMRERAYAPYSGYRVGAALLAASGQVFTGCNVENAVYPLGLCAERVAVFKAISEGEHRFTTLAIATENGGTPCGACRQVLSEFAPDLRILLVDAKGTVRETSLRALLPEPFGPENINKGLRP